MAESSYWVLHWNYCVRIDELSHIQRTNKFKDHNMSYIRYGDSCDTNPLEVVFIYYEAYIKRTNSKNQNHDGTGFGTC
jgi:hypothetical protein